MTNSPSNSHVLTRNISAKTALNELRRSNHGLGRSLAFCLMFEAPENQLLAGSVFDLAVALDAALHIPSESLLAAIRIQWWADALANAAHRNVPLVARLQSQCRMREDLLPHLQKMIGEWQVACHGKTHESGSGWAAAYRLVALHLGHRTAVDQAAIIGQNLHHATRGRRFHNCARNIDINSFRQNDQKEGRSWLYLSACLQRKLHRGQNTDLEKAQTHYNAVLDDPALVWRILGWHIFGPPR